MSTKLKVQLKNKINNNSNILIQEVGNSSRGRAAEVMSWV